MPYEIDLERDTDRGLDRYRITVQDGFSNADAHELCDWMVAAAQNPTAVFRIDISCVTRGSGRPVATVLARSAWLRARRRVEVVRRGLTSGALPGIVGAADVLMPPL
jgi:hypothetical protein